MTKDIVLSLQGPFEHAYGMIYRFIEECPDDIWLETSGGWPVWQQIYHTLNGLLFFVGQTEDGAMTRPFDMETGQLAKISTDNCDKKTLRDFAILVKAKTDEYINNLDDAKLLNKDVHLSLIMGKEITNAMIMSLLAGHTLYHLGSCDAALRNHKLPGVF